MSKILKSLQGATITWTDRLTNEKIANFVLNNEELFEKRTIYNTDFTYTLYLNSVSILEPDIINDCFLFHFYSSDNYWDLSESINIDYGGIWHGDPEASNKWPNSVAFTTFTNLQPNENTPTGLLENQAFISFMQDVCDIEGGIYEDEGTEPTTADYLQELVNQRKALANNLSEKGVEASEEETFNTLVPKVLDIDNSEEIYTELLSMTFGEDSLITSTFKVIQKNGSFNQDFEFKKGMTWEQLINSDYNILNDDGYVYFYEGGTSVYFNIYGGGHSLSLMGVDQKTTDTIIAGQMYTFGIGTGGSN